MLLQLQVKTNNQKCGLVINFLPPILQNLFHNSKIYISGSNGPIWIIFSPKESKFYFSLILGPEAVALIASMVATALLIHE